MLLWLVIKFYYYSSLLWGLSPAPLDLETWRFRPSRLYLAYSVLVHCATVAVVPLTYSSLTYTQRFPARHPIMVILFIIQSLALVAHLHMIWTSRRSLLRANEEFTAIFVRYLDLRRSPRFRRKQRLVEWMMIGKFCSAITHAALHSLLFGRLNASHEHSFARVTVASFFLTQFLANLSGVFYMVALQIYAYFSSVNEELDALLQQMKACDRRRRDYGRDHPPSTRRWRHHCKQTLLLGRLQALISLHYDCYRLADRLIIACRWNSASVAVITIFSNITVVYLVVVVANHRHQIEPSTMVMCGALMVAFYVDNAGVTNILDAMVKSCSETGQVMREFSELFHRQRVSSESLFRKLEQFVLQLMCRRLHFSICGLFDFDRQMGIRITITAILQVTVLRQYDLKLRALGRS